MGLMFAVVTVIVMNTTAIDAPVLPLPLALNSPVLLHLHLHGSHAL